MSVQLARIRGIPIRLHFTLVIAIFLITWTLASGFMPTFFPFLDTRHYLLMGIMSAIILFISVLLHELAHSILSLRYGLGVKQIVLFIFGGVSDITEETKDYHKEFRISIIGPLTSFALSGIFAMAWFISLQIAGQAAAPVLDITQGLEKTGAMNNINSGQVIDTSFVISRVIAGVLLYGAIVNAMLGAFNLLPAFPLDGGRILRTALVRGGRSYDEATRIATKVGIGISYGLMSLGFVTMLTSSFIGGLWLLLLGWFLQSGAQTYRQQVELAHILSGVRVGKIMNTAFVPVDPSVTVNELFTNYFNIYRKSEFPVTDGEGHLLGAVSTKEAMGVPPHSVNVVRVQEIMIKVDDLIVMDQNSYGDEALRRMSKENKSRVFVCNKNNNNNKGEMGKTLFKLIGIISKTDLFNAAIEWQEYERNIRR
ncbi:MAG: site-2 protease family protein [Candidatus Eiseniibacteriota bacterium]